MKTRMEWVIKEIPNDQWTLEALERLRIALEWGGENEYASVASTIISLGATRINRLTEENNKLKDEVERYQKAIKILQEKNEALVRQQRRKEREAMDHLEWPDDDRR